MLFRGAQSAGFRGWAFSFLLHIERRKLSHRTMPRSSQLLRDLNESEPYVKHLSYHQRHQYQLIPAWGSPNKEGPTRANEILVGPRGA